MLSELTERVWDVIVVGTGMGGGLVGRRLAEKGLSVLFLERGGAGRRTEEPHLFSGQTDPTAREMRGFWPEPVRATINGRSEDLWSTFGACVGGTSAFYAATLERAEHHDVDAVDERPHPTGGWPLSFRALGPFYAEAERLLEVCGEQRQPETDPTPLLPFPPLSDGDAQFKALFEARGLHPYRMHVGIRYLPGCRECAGHKCPRTCKMDGRSAGVEPAVATGRAVVLDRCHVDAFEATDRTVTTVRATRLGQRLQLRGRRYVLAAGGLGSPRVLLSSASEIWPDGLANRSGLVGRNLMFHLNEMFALWPKGRPDFSGPARTLALRDFYFRDGQRFGIVQSMGISAEYGNILMALREKLGRTRWAASRMANELLQLPAILAARVLGSAKIFVGIIEDLPVATNRVELAADDRRMLHVTYDVTAELEARRRSFRRHVARALRGRPLFFMNSGPQINFGHPCGTLRFGDDPRCSVLDRDCRAHGLDNLFVADSSFMPTSTGVNPSLTIAANALRVADAVAQDFEAGRAAIEVAA